MHCFLSLDGTDFLINEPHPFSKKWFSHKFKAAGLRYEIGLCIRSSDIVWINGPFPAGDYPDLKISRNGILEWIEPLERIVADDGYAGCWKIIHPQQGRTDNTVLRRILARHENINLKIKKFKVMSERYAGDLAFHSVIAHAVFNVLQISIDLGCDILPAVRF